MSTYCGSLALNRPIKKCLGCFGSANIRNLTVTNHSIAYSVKKPSSTNHHGDNIMRRSPQCACFTNPASVFSTYRPEDVFRDQVNAKHSRFKSRTARNLKVGCCVFVAVLVSGAVLIYKTAVDLAWSLSFFPHVSLLEQSSNVYIPLDVEAELEERHEVVAWFKKRLILFPWLQSHSNDPWRLLTLAQSDERSVRHMGVQAIANQLSWTDAEYRSLAQALDHRTLIGLARSQGSDHRMFLPPPRIPPKEEELEDSLRQLLSSLPTDNLDKCTKYFTSNALREGSKAAADERGGLWCFGGNGLAFAESLNKVQPEMVELFCLQTIVKHTRHSALWIEEGGDFYRPRIVTSESRRERLFLQSLLGVSSLSSHCPLVVKLGGLQLMRQIHDLRQNSIKIIRQLARILANLALYKDLHGEIIAAGWVTILHKWMESGDFALTLHATKALANLDRDYGETRLYPDSVYLYYPQHRYREPVYADVVFVHGLLGGPFRTWRQSDLMRPKNAQKQSTAEQLPSSADNKESSGGLSPGSADQEADVREQGGGGDDGQTEEPYTMCWPKDWLAGDCPHIRILTVEYETHLTDWAPRCPYEGDKRTIAMRGQELLRKLKMAGIGDRPVIWVGHSMGGLLIKQMLVAAAESPSLRHIVDRSRGIVMYSVPHRGSPLAAYSNQSKYLLYPSTEVRELTTDSPHLLQLHEEFTNLMFDVGIPMLSFSEGQKTELPFNLKVLIVPPESSDPGFGEVHHLPDLTHLTICKPLTRQSALYQQTLQFIQDCVPAERVQHILRANLKDDYIFPQDLGEKRQTEPGTGVRKHLEELGRRIRDAGNRS